MLIKIKWEMSFNPQISPRLFMMSSIFFFSSSLLWAASRRISMCLDSSEALWLNSNMICFDLGSSWNSP